MIIISRLKLNADAGVGEEVGGVAAEAPADADANFEVGRHQIVEAGADVRLGQLVFASVGEDAKVL